MKKLNLRIQKYFTISSFLLFISFLPLGPSYAANSCLQFLQTETSAGSQTAQDLIRVYAGKGVVVPDQLICDFCGVGNLMPPNLNDPRISILNTTADIQALSQQSGGLVPNLPGVTIRCNGCGGHSPIWELQGPNEPPKFVATTKDLEIHTDTENGRRYVELPREYQELARRDSELNRIARGQHIAICPSCAVTALLASRPENEVQCTGCGDAIPDDNVYYIPDIIGASARRSNPATSNAANPSRTSRVRDNSRPAATQNAVIPTRYEVTQGRSALSRFSKKWIASGVAALGILAGGSYYMNNTPVIAEGAVFQIRDNIATVHFQETPYYSNDSQLESYEVQIVLSDRMTLPGEEPLDVLPGDRVTVHYTWSDFHFLPFVFHPYSGAEFFDGSIVGGDDIE